MESLTEWWNSVMDIPGASWIIYPSLLFVFVLVAYYVLQALRNLAIGGAPVSDDHLGTFRKMRDDGMLAPEEYKKLAGLVPLPDAGAKEVAAPDTESGPQALTEAAREALQKAAQKRAENESKENEDSGADEEDAESSES